MSKRKSTLKTTVVDGAATAVAAAAEEPRKRRKKILVSEPVSPTVDANTAGATTAGATAAGAANGTLEIAGAANGTLEIAGAKMTSREKKYAGAFVLEPLPGVHRQFVSTFDTKSAEANTAGATDGIQSAEANTVGATDGTQSAEANTVGATNAGAGGGTKFAEANTAAGAGDGTKSAEANTAGATTAGAADGTAAATDGTGAAADGTGAAIGAAAAVGAAAVGAAAADAAAVAAAAAKGRPAGFRVVMDAICEAEEALLLAMVRNFPATVFQQPGQPDGPAVYEFGWNYDTNRATPTALSNKHCLLPPPTWSHKLLASLHKAGLRPSTNGSSPPDVLDHVMINKYPPGRGLHQHFDNPDFWGSWVLGVTLGSGATLRLEDSKNSLTHDVYLPPRSAYIMEGDSRYLWQHGVTAEMSDMVNGTCVWRTERVAITLRPILPNILTLDMRATAAAGYAAIAFAVPNNNNNTSATATDHGS